MKTKVRTYAAIAALCLLALPGAVAAAVVEAVHRRQDRRRMGADR